MFFGLYVGNLKDRKVCFDGGSGGDDAVCNDEEGPEV